MRIPAIAAFLLLIITQLQAQNMPTNRDLAVMELKALKNGALVVRLKTNDRSIELYRKAGKT
ncbi:MAG TPA: hypothetical protein VG603_11855, partial [Chitinophagales bacterium]|nr:hypothetical protein [Chitinophagales bacterium]